MLYTLLEYELHAAERYRRFVSLVMVSTEGDIPGLMNELGRHVRKSDVVANFDHSLAVLMGETDKSDALSAVRRYCDLLMNQSDLRFSVATYPDDGVKPDGLVQAAYRRLSKARNNGGDSVVWTD